MEGRGELPVIEPEKDCCSRGACNPYAEYVDKAGISEEELQEMQHERDRERMIDARQGDH